MAGLANPTSHQTSILFLADHTCHKVYTQAVINAMLHDYNAALYSTHPVSSPQELHAYVIAAGIKRLLHDMVALISCDIHVQEVRKSIRSMARRKVPGMDRLLIEQGMVPPIVCERPCFSLSINREWRQTSSPPTCHY